MDKHDHRRPEEWEGNGSLYNAHPEGKHIMPTSRVTPVFADVTRDTRPWHEIADGKPRPQYVCLLIEETERGETILHPQKEPEE